MQVNACLSFNSHCREALNFYKECVCIELNFQALNIAYIY
jgi:uncharacterized glyoxalase superfamily protein PhnB